MSKIMPYKSHVPLVVPADAALYKAVIFDLGEVVFTSDSGSYFSKLAKKSLRAKLFQFLHQASEGLLPHDSSMDPELPTLLANWLTGLSGSDAQLHLERHVRRANYSHVTSKLWLTLSQYIFDLHVFVDSMKRVEPVVDLIRTLKEQGYQLYVLSNWDHESFSHLHEKHADLFALFDGIMISGHEKIGKPNKQIYARLLNRYSLKSSECLFIDDLADNVQAACSMGIRALQMNSYQQLLEDFKQVGLVAPSGMVPSKNSGYSQAVR